MVAPPATARPQIALRRTSYGVHLNLQPPLKWAGGKRWLVPEFQKLWARHSFRRLVEPFCGGLATTLASMPERALVNDINPHPINCYRWIQRGLEIHLPLTNSSEVFYAYRTRFNRLVEEGGTTTKTAAELFYYLNRTCYNGLCRFNKRGQFNVPFGRYTAIRYVTNFRSYVPVLKNWTFRSTDFERVPLDAEDFIYADPPYDVPFRQYSKEGFSWDDQERLVDWLVEHHGPVVLSNQATDRVTKLYRSRGFDLKYLSAPRRISCNGDRTRAREVLATRGL